MGIVFVILIHLVAIFILSVIIATIASVITYFLSDKGKRKRKLLLAALSPFVGLYTIYFCALFGSIVVSETKNIDIGIGDTWYVPLPDNCQLLFIDLPEQAYIEKNGQTIISDVSQLQQRDNKIIGKTYSNKYFAYQTKTNELIEFSTENELIIQNSNIKPKLINAIEFYTEKRNDIVGSWSIIVGLFSLIISVTLLYLMKKLILGKRKTE